MTTLTAEFRIPKKIWLDSNQRLNPIVKAKRVEAIRALAEPIWEKALADQHKITRRLPSEQEMETAVNGIITSWGSSKKNRHHDTEPDTEGESLLSQRLEELKSLLTTWDDGNKRRLDALKRKKSLSPEESAQKEHLISQRQNLKERVERQRKALSIMKKKNAKLRTAKTRHSDADRKKARLQVIHDLNANNRLFNEPVRMYIRAHNISKHLFDATNCYPTLKGVEDAGTETGILWEDDNITVIPSHTFLGAPIKSRDYYVLDIIVDTLDEDLRGEDAFIGFDEGTETSSQQI